MRHDPQVSSRSGAGPLAPCSHLGDFPKRVGSDGAYNRRCPTPGAVSVEGQARRVLIQALLTFVLLPLVSCSQLDLGQWSSPRWRDDGGGSLTVFQPGERRRPDQVRTRRSQIPLQVGEPPLFGARIEARWGAERWALLPLNEQTGLSILDATREGEYELRPAVGGNEEAQASLRLRVDRQGPVVDVDSVVEESAGSRWQAALQVNWSVQDANGVDEVTVEFSDDAGATWRLLATSSPAVGGYRWSIPPGSLRQQQLRVTARDLIGNRTARIFPLDPELLAEHERDEARNQTAIASTSGPAGRGDSNSSPGSTNVLGAGESGAGELAAGDLTADNPDGNDRNDVGLDEMEFDSNNPTTAEGTNNGVESRALWSEFERWGTRARGGARVRIPESATEVALRVGDNRLSLQLDRSADGHFVVLPQRSGGPHTLEVTAGVELPPSPQFWIDADPPSIELLDAVGGAGEVELTWSANDLAPISDELLQVDLHFHDGREWQQRSLLGVSPLRVPLVEGSYEIYLSATDLAGNFTRTESTRRVDVTAGGPRVLNFANETFRGGSSHYIFIDRGGLDGVVGPIEVRAVATTNSPTTPGESEPIPVGVIPDVQRKLLWEVPASSGEYWLELVWNEGGQQRVQRARDSFEIDATAPKLQWETRAHRVAFETTLSWLRDDEDRIETLELFRRRDESMPWEQVQLAPHSWTTSEDHVRLRLSTESWPEGSWRLGVRASDPLGNLTVEPLEGPSIEIDQRAPRVSALEVIAAVAAAPLTITARIDEPPAVSTLRLTYNDGSVLHRSVEWVEHQGVWQGTALPLPYGEGEMAVAFEDALGNRVEEERPVQIVPGVTTSQLDPKRLFTGDSFRVSYELRPPHPVPDSTLELQLLTFADSDAEDSRPLERLVISRRRGTVAMQAPQRAGVYALRFYAGESLAADLHFEVLERSDNRTAVNPTRGNTAAQAASGRTDEGGVPVLSTEALVVEFRNFEWAWRDTSRRRELSSKHAQLSDALERSLARNPGESVVRQAAARMQLFQMPPDTDRAKQILGAGIEQLRAVESMSARQTSQLADLLNDLAAIELRLSEWKQAESHLLNALLLEESSTRRYNLGQVFYSTRKFDQARREFQRAIEIDSAHIGAQRAWVATVRALGADAVRGAQRQLDQWKQTQHLDADQARALSLLLTRAE